jgi:hypothetical protein
MMPRNNSHNLTFRTRTGQDAMFLDFDFWSETRSDCQKWRMPRNDPVATRTVRASATPKSKEVRVFFLYFSLLSGMGAACVPPSPFKLLSHVRLRPRNSISSRFFPQLCLSVKFRLMSETPGPRCDAILTRRSLRRLETPLLATTCQTASSSFGRGRGEEKIRSLPTKTHFMKLIWKGCQATLCCST